MRPAMLDWNLKDQCELSFLIYANTCSNISIDCALNLLKIILIKVILYHIPFIITQICSDVVECVISVTLPQCISKCMRGYTVISLT